MLLALLWHWLRLWPPLEVHQCGFCVLSLRCSDPLALPPAVADARFLFLAHSIIYCVLRHLWKCVSASSIAATTMTIVVLYRHCTNSVLLHWLSALQWHFALQLYFALQRCFQCQLWYSCRSICCRICNVVEIFQVVGSHLTIHSGMFSSLWSSILGSGPSSCVISIGFIL